VDLESLLSRGMFPRELPTAFSSADFASKRGRLNTDSKEKRWRAPAVFNLARPGDLRRRLSIPNPFSQVALARACQDNWAELQLHFERSSISLSKPRAQGTGRAIGLSKGYRTLAAERASRMTRGKYGGQALDWDPVVDRAEAAEALDNSDWLLAYEFIRNGWADQSALTDQAHWRDALLVDIGFFESWARAGKPMSRWGVLVAGRLPGVALSRGYE